MHLVGLEMVWVSSTSLRPKMEKMEFWVTNLGVPTTRGATPGMGASPPTIRGTNPTTKAAIPHHAWHPPGVLQIIMNDQCVNTFTPLVVGSL